MKAIRHMPAFLGCAVTKPNKIRVLDYLDELDPLCEKIGACNTVCRTQEGRLIGYNTDAVGFFRSIAPLIDVRGASFFCAGAGGVGRAICAVLAHHGAARIVITDKCMESAERLRDDLKNAFCAADVPDGGLADAGGVFSQSGECVSVETAPFGCFAQAAECDVVINATGVGMGASVGQSPIPQTALRAGQLCFDACYNPAKTQFLLEAEACGCRIQNGLDMCLFQGAAQFELWTGSKAPVDAMRRELEYILYGKEELSV